jgi:hypothetical protein
MPRLATEPALLRKLPPTAAEDLLRQIMRQYKRASTILTSYGPADD